MKTSSLASSPRSQPVCQPSTGLGYARSEFALRLTLVSCSEPDLYHDTSAPDGTAYFAMLTGTRDADGRRQNCYPVSSMPLVLENLDPSLNTWISQAEFFTWTRRLVHFKRVGLAWVDVDTYKIPALQTRTPDQLLSILLTTCENVGVPEPSLVVFSGRGLQVKWLFDCALPRPALPRWNLVQRELCLRLEKIGGDPKACDGSRVLRLVDTVNTTSGAVVKVIHSPLHTYNFDKLADSMLPLTRAELQELRERRQHAEEHDGLVLQDVKGRLDRANASKPTGHLVSTHSKGNLRPFVPSQLAWDRLNDLDKLAELRGFSHGAPDGHRDTFVFLGSTFLAQAIVHVPRFSLEVNALAEKYAPRWSKDRVRQCTSGVVDRMRRFLAGERVEFNGRTCDPRYTFNNTTLLDWLEITPAEEQEMTTLISKPEKARRHADTERNRRRSEGALTRAEYIAKVGATAEQKRATGRLIRAQGDSWAAVATAVGYKNATAARVACAV